MAYSGWEHYDFKMTILMVNTLILWLSGAVFYEESGTTYADLILKRTRNDEQIFHCHISKKDKRGVKDTNTHFNWVNLQKCHK